MYMCIISKTYRICKVRIVSAYNHIVPALLIMSALHLQHLSLECISVCELVYKPEARVEHLACRSIKNLYEIARRSIEKFEIHVQNNRFGLLKFNLGYRSFCLNSPKGYSTKIFSAQTDVYIFIPLQQNVRGWAIMDSLCRVRPEIMVTHYLVRSINPTLIERFYLVLAQMFTSTRGCAEPM